MGCERSWLIRLSGAAGGTGEDGPGVVDREAGAGSGDPVAVLQRWEDSGAVWRVEHRAGGTVTVALLTCDGGEQVGELRCADDDVREFLAGRLTNAVD